MNEMIEQMAHRFAAEERWNWSSLHETDDTSFGWGRDHIRTRIRQVLCEMRVPTEAMTTAAFKGHWTCDGETDLATVWRTMIDAALNE